MKVLKVFLYVLVALVLLVVIFSFMGPKSYDVNKTRVLAYPQDRVWLHINSLQKVHDWGPWAKMDTTMVVEWSGEEGAVGSMQKWESKQMGKGEQTILAVDPGKSIETNLKFIMGFPFGTSESTSYMRLQDTSGNTKLTWGMKGNNNFFGRVMSVFMNADKAIGPMFEAGFNNLDTLLMSEPASTAPSYTIVPGDYAGGNYLGVREKVKIAEMESFFGKNYQAVGEAAKKANAEITGPPTGVYYMWDMEGGNTDVAAAFPVKAEVKPPAGISFFTVPASKSLTMDYMGGYGGLYGAHMAFDNYIKANKLEHIAPVLEEYITDPMTQPDSNKWHTRIIYLVK